MSDAKEVEGKQTQAVAIEGVQYYSNKASVLLSGIPERKISGCTEIFYKII